MDNAPDKNIISMNFKVRFILKFCLFVFICAVISGIMLYIATYKNLGTVYYQALSGLKDVKAILVPVIIMTGIFQTGFLGIIVIIAALYASNKIAGPIYRLANTIKDICSTGDLTSSIRFRKDDPVEDIAETFNCMIRSICERLTCIKHGLLKIDELERKMNEVIEGREIDREQLNLLKKTMESEIAAIKKELAGFKIN